MWYKGVGFMTENAFLRSYNKGASSGHMYTESPSDLHIEWRVHVILALARYAAHLDGDFVECGVNTGIYSLAICDYIDFNHTGKNFWLFDTFKGVPKSQITEEEIQAGRLNEESNYGDCFARVKENFSPYAHAKLVRGCVPETLHSVPIDRVCFLSIDMNIAYPEKEALNYFWDKLVPGAPVIFDDYGWKRYRAQKDAHDAFAATKKLTICELPTGQGVLFKPPDLKAKAVSN